LSSNDFDPLLLSKVRLGVVSVLMERRQATFSDLKQLLGLTQGNLGIHLQKLEEAGYVRIDKSFVNRKPQTRCELAPAGRAAFLAHVDQLRRIAENPLPE
jgi:DNA-binding MarR family transcriptional regulator